MNKECRKCNKVFKLVETSDRGSKPLSLFCKPCAQRYVNLGRSLVDEYLQEQFSYYNPSGPYILKCDCGIEQTYTTKYSLVRVLQTTGRCGKCSKAMNRQGWTLSKEYAKNRKLNSYNSVYGTDYTDVSQIPTFPISLKRYRKKVQKMSETQLKRYKPDEYNRLINNRWDGTDMNKLTIDHLREVGWCYRNGVSIEECSDISNLEVVTMKENNRRYNEKRN